MHNRIQDIEQECVRRCCCPLGLAQLIQAFNNDAADVALEWDLQPDPDNASEDLSIDYHDALDIIEDWDGTDIKPGGLKYRQEAIQLCIDLGIL